MFSMFSCKAVWETVAFLVSGWRMCESSHLINSMQMPPVGSHPPAHEYLYQNMAPVVLFPPDLNKQLPLTGGQPPNYVQDGRGVGYSLDESEKKRSQQARSI